MKKEKLSFFKPSLLTKLQVMKRGNNKLFLIILLSILVLPFISGLEIKLFSDSYQSGETLQAEITGNFVSLKSENVLIYKEGTPRLNPVVSDLTYQDGIYYFYAVLPREEGNFSLRIEDSQYFEQENLKSDTIIKTFTIKNTNKSSLSINPGFVITDKNFAIKVKSLKDNQNLNANFEAIQEIKNISLIEGVEESIDFSISNLEPMKTYVSVNNYRIPVFITKAGDKTSIAEQADLRFYPSEKTGTLLAGNSYYYEFKLVNTGEKNLTEIKISSDIDATIEPDLIKSLKTKSYAKINLTITPEKGIKDISGEVIATLDKKNISLPIKFKITEKVEDINISTGSQIDCNDIGKQCLSNEICNGVIRESKQGACCLGNCIKVTKSSNNNLYIGIGILIVVLIITFIFYKNLKKRQKPKTTEEFLKERTEEYRNRLTGKEVNKKLDRV